jgi:6-phosphogluconolactonase
MKTALRNGFVLGLIVLFVGACNNEGPDHFTYYFAYVVNSGSNNISAYQIDPSTGALEELNNSPVSAASQPVSIAIDPAGKFAYVANSGSNNISAYSIQEEADWGVAQGALRAISGSPFPAGAFPRSVAFSPDGKFVYVADYGAVGNPGQISAFAVNSSTGALTTITGSPFAAGINPYSIVVEPSGKFAYVANQWGHNISAYSVNTTTGALAEIAGSPFPTAWSPNSVAVDPSGKFAYVANQSDNHIYAYSVNATTGALTAVAGSPFQAGWKPSSFAFDPTGKFVYAANAGEEWLSGDISAYAIDSSTGVLTAIAGSPFPAGLSPRFVAFDPTGKFAYVANADSNDVSAYSFNSATGALTPIAGSPIPAGTRPVSIATSKIYW